MVVDNYGDCKSATKVTVGKSPNWGCGTPSTWPFHGL